jgi:oligoribonuclease (3'-5' exoribonuclease)
MPAVLREVHYRSIDASSQREFVRRVWPTLELPPKNETHRAVPDIFASLDTMLCVAHSLQLRP